MKLRVPFHKVQSVGNDFVLVEEADFSGDWHELARRASSRHFGIGSDGLLTVKMVDGTLAIRMFNPDGTEDFCGNGIRCCLLYAFRHGWISERASAFHGGEVIEANVIRDPLAPSDPLLRFTLPAATYDPAMVPTTASREIFDQPISTVIDLDFPGPVITGQTRGSLLSTGSTHMIVWVSQLPDEDEFLSIAPALENAPIFPQRTSVMFTQVVTTDELRMRIWERGAGETFGCGTGSTAAAVDYLRLAGRGGEVLVHNPGGDLMISATEWDRPVTVSGKADILFQGTYYFAG